MSSSSVGLCSPVTMALRCMSSKHDKQKKRGKLSLAGRDGSWPFPPRWKELEGRTHLVVERLVQAVVLLIQQGNLVLELHLQLDVLALQLLQRADTPLGLGRELQPGPRPNQALQLALNGGRGGGASVGAPNNGTRSDVEKRRGGAETQAGARGIVVRAVPFSLRLSLSAVAPQTPLGAQWNTHCKRGHEVGVIHEPSGDGGHVKALRSVLAFHRESARAD